MILDVFITKANRNMQQQIMGTKLYSIFDRIMGNCFYIPYSLVIGGSRKVSFQYSIK